MIKENELRIGNWVIIDDMPPEQITLGTFAMLKGYPFHLSKFRPIPLTPEILEACGFKKWGSCYTVDKNNWRINYTYQDKKFSLSDQAWNNRSRDFEIKYLHQLQNLYYSLTGQELEVKFPQPA